MKDNCGCGGNCVCETNELDFGPKYKYHEDLIINTLHATIDRTYETHYMSDDNLQCFDAWLSLGGASETCRNTALKYLWRYGKKEGNNVKDLYKAMHYIVLLIHADKFVE